MAKVLLANNSFFLRRNHNLKASKVSVGIAKGNQHGPISKFNR